MDEREKAVISGQFIETLLQVPVSVCPNRLKEIEICLRTYLPEFLKNSVPFFITESMVKSFEPQVLYHITDFLNFHFILFLYEGRSRVFLTGPYLTHQPDDAFCEKTLQENGKNYSFLVPFKQYCLTLPVITNSQMIEAARTALKTVTGYTLDAAYRHYQPQASHNREISNLSPEGVDEAAREMLEQRYYFEKLMLQEVAQGNQDMALKYYRQFSSYSQSIVRTEDPVRTFKNLSFSLNTMLRKCVETTGIHPVYLDIISSNFAMLIENSNNLNELKEFRFQMISAYCRYVQKLRLDNYSPLVQKAVTYIRLHLADRLTLAKVAEGIKVSSSYLSRQFNAEMRDSISNYITKARIDKASELLTFSGMSIQNIAFYVGFSDFNYFSRCFKKYKGMTPTAWRNTSSIGS